MSRGGRQAAATSVLMVCALCSLTFATRICVNEWRILLVGTNGHVDLVPCVTGVFDFSHTVCCNTGSDCCGSNFTMEPGIPFTPDYLETADIVLSSLTSSSVSPTTPPNTFAPLPSTLTTTSLTTCASILPTNLPANTESLSKSTGSVAAAIGASLSALLLGVLVFLAYRERGWKRSIAEKQEWIDYLQGKYHVPSQRRMISLQKLASSQRSMVPPQELATGRN